MAVRSPESLMLVVGMTIGVVNYLFCGNSKKGCAIAVSMIAIAVIARAARSYLAYQEKYDLKFRESIAKENTIRNQYIPCYPEDLPSKARNSKRKVTFQV